VYQIQSGGKSFAVKCFNRESQDRQRRYNLISQYLKTVNHPALVKFEYQHKGIQVGAQALPIVKMEWIPPESLHTFVKNHLHQPSELLNLAGKWRDLIKGLRQAHIAHGDLQHGNILISRGHLKLVDYDGMFVPPLRGEQCSELGYPNYQHPKRCSHDYDETLDNFSALVIYLSLRALAADTNSANFFDPGENLIFLKEDFEAPLNTPVWHLLSQSPDSGVQQLTQRLAQACVVPLAQVPDLETSLRGVSAPPKQALQSASTQTGTTPLPQLTYYQGGSSSGVRVRQGVIPISTAGSGSRQQLARRIPVATQSSPQRPTAHWDWGLATVSGVIALIVIGVIVWLASTLVWRSPHPASSLQGVLQAYVTATPLQGYAPLTVSFDAIRSSDANGQIVSYTWDFGDGGSSSGVSNPSHTYSTPGQYTVRLVVKDNRDTTSEKTVLVSVLTGGQGASTAGIPHAHASAAPLSGQVPLFVTFDGSQSSDIGGTITDYYWNFGDGISWRGLHVSHTYTTPGAYTVRLIVTDNTGETNEDTVAVKVLSFAQPSGGDSSGTTNQLNSDPVAVASTDRTAGSAPLEVNFNGSLSTSGSGYITTYYWDFGDGTPPAYGMAVSHTFTTPGTYHSKLWIRNSNGEWSNSYSTDISVLTAPLR
jgi:PKD repeat protein